MPPGASGNRIDVVEPRHLQRFATIDTAGTSQQKADEKKGKPACWSVSQIWDYWQKPKYLFVARRLAEAGAWDGLKSGVRQVLSQWRPSRVLIENAHFGPALKSELTGFNAQLLTTSPARPKGHESRPGKLEWATTLLNMLEQGRVFLPRYKSTWLPDRESEWLVWTGLADETADQIDATAYAAQHVHTGSQSWGGPIVIDTWGRRGSPSPRYGW